MLDVYSEDTQLFFIIYNLFILLMQRFFVCLT